MLRRSRGWSVRLTIPSGLFVGLALAWTCWANQRPSQGPQTAAGPLATLARALMDLGRTDEAVQAFQQAIGLPNAVSQSYYLLGQANLQSGNFAQAKENFQRTVTLQPDHTQAFFALYRACLRLGQTEEAQ